MEQPVEQRELARILCNWRDERDSAALSRALARLERNPRLSRVFARLAEAERQHSEHWELPFLIASPGRAIAASIVLSLPRP